MFKSILFVQWQWSRRSVLLLLAPMVILPFWSMSSLLPTGRIQGPNVLEYMNLASIWYTLVVVAAGFLLAMHAWRTDHVGRNVYALSLPVERWRFALYRYGAGALFGGLIVMAFWISGMLAVAAFGVPAGLHAYPNQLALRVGMALMVSYALFSAVWSNTRNAAYLVAAAWALVLAVFLISEILHTTAVTEALSRIWAALGLRDTFGGRWFLIDV